MFISIELEKKRKICQIVDGQKSDKPQVQKKETAPTVPFFTAQADQLFFVSDSIQPFADIVRNNTCCDGTQKSNNILHKYSPPFQRSVSRPDNDIRKKITGPMNRECNQKKWCYIFGEKGKKNILII